MENESIGFLQVIVKTASGALPIEDANVTIYEYRPNDSGDLLGRGNIVYSLVTDRNGRTEKVALKTKSKELSTSPGNDTPFLTYNIRVSKDGFYENSYINAPVFQGVTSLQPVELIPVMEFSQELDDLPSTTIRFNETTNNKL